MTAGEVHAVVVAYGEPDQLNSCLAGLEGEAGVTVVDNSSSRQVARIARQHGAAYIDPGSNLGFGAGVNVALRRLVHHPPEFVLLINPDAVVDSYGLRLLVSHMRGPENGRIAALSPTLRGSENVPQRVAWPFPTPARAWAEAVGLGRIPSRHVFVIGAVLMLRWKAISEVGLFDEQFFLYADEADWQRRARGLGWASAVCPEAIAVHAGAGASASPLRREALFHAAQETYIRKWHGSVGWWVYRTATAIGATARALVLPGERSIEARRRAAIYLRGPRRFAALVRD